MRVERLEVAGSIPRRAFCRRRPYAAAGGIAAIRTFARRTARHSAGERSGGLRRDGERMAGVRRAGERLAADFWKGGAVGRRAGVLECGEAESGRPECIGPPRGARRSGVGRSAEHPSGERSAGEHPSGERSAGVRATGRKRATGVRSTLDAVRALVPQGAPGDCRPLGELPSAPWRERSTAQSRST